MTQVAYNRGTKILHWISAIVIIWALVSGFAVSWFDFSDSIEHNIASFNVLITTVVTPLFIVRILWNYLFFKRRYTDSRPKELIARLVHDAMYIVTLFVLITGMLMLSQPVVIFDAVVVPVLIADESARKSLIYAHIYGNFFLLSLFTTHILAVVWNELFDGNRILRKML